MSQWEREEVLCHFLFLVNVVVQSTPRIGIGGYAITAVTEYAQIALISIKENTVVADTNVASA